MECELTNKTQWGIYKTLNEFNIIGTRGVRYHYTHINKLKVKIIISSYTKFNNVCGFIFSFLKIFFSG